MKIRSESLRQLGLCLALFLVAASARADAPRVFLSWHAPFGLPRATDTLTTACGDGGQDTLFLTFETGADTTTFLGLEAMLLMRAPFGQTLSERWNTEECAGVVFPGDSIPGVTRPWRGSMSLNFTFYDRTQGSGRLRLSNVRPPSRPVAVRDSVPYLYARVLFPHPPAGTPGWDQPVCIEWADSEFLMDTTSRSSTIVHYSGHRYVSMNSPGGAVCEPFLPSVTSEEKPAVKPARRKPGKPKGK